MDGRSRNAIGAVLRIGLIAGTLDIGENIVFNAARGIGPSRIFEYIASAAMGAAAFRGGVWPILLGATMHYGLALFWTAVFFAASRRWALLVRRPAVSGPGFGAAIYLVANVVVVPRTRVVQAAAVASVAARVNGLLAMMECVGLTVAVLTARERRGAGGAGQGRGD